MVRESLPLLIALLLPLAGAAGLMPAQQGVGSRSAPALPPPPPAAAAAPVRLTLPEGPATGPAVAGLWLNF